MARRRIRYALCGVAGLVLGGATAIASVRGGALGSSERIGAWTTGRDLGTDAQSGHGRAVVALRGLLALPGSEARYYNAAVDDAGDPLRAECRYTVHGGSVPGRWWSLTLYDRDGYLVPNPAGLFSVGSAAIPGLEQDDWTVEVAPDRQPGHWLPSGEGDRFELTFRVYLPADRGQGNLSAAQLPSIVRRDCR
ncbi:DUF1214 domain-containing protein [Sphingomonas aracearum]|uniref:DUF1214 domain-containing protein n=1 Tax=Sphingomonas aracearum TaxID=2283317 RepID=UPI0015F007C4|nr:DUF1214 domain-containing protein [Sphingomonas aracearum]